MPVLASFTNLDHSPRQARTVRYSTSIEVNAASILTSSAHVLSEISPCLAAVGLDPTRGSLASTCAASLRASGRSRERTNTGHGTALSRLRTGPCQSCQSDQMLHRDHASALQLIPLPRHPPGAVSDGICAARRQTKLSYALSADSTPGVYDLVVASDTPCSSTSSLVLRSDTVID